MTNTTSRTVTRPSSFWNRTLLDIYKTNVRPITIVGVTFKNKNRWRNLYKHV